MTPPKPNQTVGQEILPCRKCGFTDVDMWHGQGTQANISCNECGEEENIQVSDLYDYGEKPEFDMKTLSYPADVVAKCKVELIKEWNTRVLSAASWLTIGKYSLKATATGIHISLGDGEGGEFNTEKLEKVIGEFYDREF